VLLAGMLIIGLWVTRQIEANVVRNTAASTALYVDSIIAPLLPDLRTERSLSEGQRQALDEVLAHGEIGQRLASLKLWHPDGEIFYASDPSLVGKRFPSDENLAKALTGRVAAEFDDLSDEENISERRFVAPLIEIYSPIREPWSGEVVAVIEFYEIADDFYQNLHAAAFRSWLVVGGVTAAMMGILATIVSKGSRVIAVQRAALQNRVKELSELLDQNRALRMRVEGAARNAASTNERYMRRISADLHDGPAQLLAFAALRMDSPSLTDPLVAPDERLREMTGIKSCLEHAMLEIRSICSGLTLPQLEKADLVSTIELAAAAHQSKTGQMVGSVDVECNPPLGMPEKICIFRFVQETLNNASRHAPGASQRVSATERKGILEIEVSDDGPGFDISKIRENSLGLASLRERVESIGGRFQISADPSGTSVSMLLELGGM